MGILSRSVLVLPIAATIGCGSADVADDTDSIESDGRALSVLVDDPGKILGPCGAVAPCGLPVEILEVSYIDGAVTPCGAEGAVTALVSVPFGVHVAASKGAPFLLHFEAAYVSNAERVVVDTTVALAGMKMVKSQAVAIGEVVAGGPVPDDEDAIGASASIGLPSGPDLDDADMLYQP